MGELLLNKVVKNCYINEDKTTIKLECDNLEFIDLETHGDCCSESWIEHIDGVCNLKKSSKIIEIISKDLGEVIPTRQESDQLYSIEFKLKRVDGYNWDSRFFIEFRNSSNGYYGGWIKPKIGNNNLDGFKEIMEDF